MWRYLYTFLFYLILPAIILRLMWRSRSFPDYRQRFGERFGYFKVPALSNTIWIHAVSLGETLAAAPLIKALQKQYPQHSFVITNMTYTGSRQVRTLFGNSVLNLYVPYDLPGPISRFLQKIKPRVVILIETELWPNMLQQCYQKQIPVILANARLSAKSARNYSRFAQLTQQTLSHLTLLIAQAPADAQRFIDLGMDSKKIKVTGNIKFDITAPEDLPLQAKQLREKWNAHDRPIWIAASTHPGEEEIVLNAFAQIRKTLPDTLLILVPRHPERRSDVLQLCSPYQTAIRTENSKIDKNTDIVLVDTIGELLLFYALSDVAFVGGSLVPIGGHNLLEPAVVGTPALTGPHMFNFTEINRLLQVISITSSEGMAHHVLNFLQNSDVRQAAGLRSRQIVQDNRGALQAHLEWIGEIINKNPFSN